MRPIVAKVCAKKLSGELAKGEVPDTAAPTHSTASRGLFATLGESSRYFNHPKTYNTHTPKIRAILALVVPVSRLIAPFQPCPRWGASGLAQYVLSLTIADFGCRILAAIPVHRAGER